jgi:ribosomal protein S18 acetylase RimI-like enzyme
MVQQIEEHVGTVRVQGFDQRFAKDFADLNYAWIEKYFGIEEHDRELLDHPFEQIVEPGGEIFFAVSDERVCGTAAMISTNNRSFELSKMAVSPDLRGRGISNALMDACIEFARAKGAEIIWLETNSKLPAAIGLYRKYGFEHTELDPNTLYSRANVRMELRIGAQ